MKDVAKEQDEEEKDRKMMSDSAAITDANYKDLMSTKAAWLVLFYSCVDFFPSSYFCNTSFQG